MVTCIAGPTLRRQERWGRKDGISSRFRVGFSIRRPDDDIGAEPARREERGGKVNDSVIDIGVICVGATVILESGSNRRTPAIVWRKGRNWRC
ncbi:hypothetical protein Tco_0500944 [Tanacetum coccineum]